MIVLGDRYEILSAATSALLLNIPIAHIHGGEESQGAFDNSIRHAITKMSHIHFAATKSAQNRIIQMGEYPESVFLVGGLGVDNLQNLNRLPRKALEAKYGIEFADRNILVTYHPDTVNPESSRMQFEELLQALETQKEALLIFTAPNLDIGGRELLSRLRDFVSSKNNCVLIESLGFQDYISIAGFSNGVIGNSSSGLLEIPSLGVGTINIGSRQNGREMASSVINCEPTKESICRAILKLKSDAFQETLNDVDNPYGKGGAVEKIYEVMKTINPDNLRFKPFINIL
jgi:GDP/UDP-N,N'-diacetylbacillosamine 2-epimerase (hydrolysing)